MSEQENLIKTLHKENIAKNALYTKLFLAVPLVSILPYLPNIFDPHTSLLSLLSISSLLSTAYILSYLPHNRTGLTAIDSLNAPKSKPGVVKLPKLGDIIDQGPVELYLASLNAVLVALLGVAGMLVRSEKAWVGFGALPGLAFGIVLAAKYFMASVDIGQLEGLKYPYKGA